MKQLKYFYLREPIGRKETGVKETVVSSGEQIYELSEPNRTREQYKRYRQNYRFEHLPADLDLNVFELHPKSKSTHILSSMYLNTVGLFISPKLHDFLQDFKVYGAKYYPIMLNKGAEKIDWYYMHLLSSSKELMDYSLSEIVVIDKIDQEKVFETVNIQDYDAYINKNREFINKEENKMLSIKKIVLKQEYDLLGIPFQVDVFVNEKVKEKIKKEFITWNTLGEFEAYEVFVK